MDNRYILDIIEQNLKELENIIIQTKGKKQIPGIYVELMLLKLKTLFLEVSLLNKSEKDLIESNLKEFKNLEEQFSASATEAKNFIQKDSISQVAANAYSEIPHLKTKERVVKNKKYRIREHISLNDKIWFIKELFDGSIDLYNQTVNYIEKMDNLEQVVEYLTRFFSWDLNDQTTRDFFVIISKKFEK